MNYSSIAVKIFRATDQETVGMNYLKFASITMHHSYLFLTSTIQIYFHHNPNKNEVFETVK